MDGGAEVAWPERHNPDELSAVQHAMNLKLQDEVAFWAEYQNEPLPEEKADEDLLTADLYVADETGRAVAVLPHGQITDTGGREKVGQAPGDAVHIVLHGGRHRESLLPEAEQRAQRAGQNILVSYLREVEGLGRDLDPALIDPLFKAADLGSGPDLEVFVHGLGGLLGHDGEEDVAEAGSDRHLGLGRADRRIRRGEANAEIQDLCSKDWRSSRAMRLGSERAPLRLLDQPFPPPAYGIP